MSTSASLGLLDCSSGTELRPERRERRRHKAAFRPCCIIIDGQTTRASMCNFSIDGARIEIRSDLAVGEEISYFWKVRSCMRARIIWNSGSEIGVEHIADNVPIDQTRYPVRPVRAAVVADAQCSIVGKTYTVTVENISEKGLRLRGLPNLRLGARGVVRIGAFDLPMATLRWQDRESGGLELTQQLSPKELASLLIEGPFAFPGVEAKASNDPG